jgi:Lon protease-like protein
MSVRLPLFPLGSVLVPGLVLPLHIFEPRYRVLVEALMALPEAAPRHFGVVALRSGREVGPVTAGALYPVGCTAELREVTPYSDGRFDIVGVGEARFRIGGIDDAAGTPYLTGLVDFLPEPDGDGDLEALTGAVTRQFADYRGRLGVEVTELPDDPRVVSYLVAAAAVLEVSTRQALLEQPTTTDRLRAEVALLRRERALVKEFGALPAQDLGVPESGLN